MPSTFKNRVYHVKDYETHEILITLNTFGELADYFGCARAQAYQKTDVISKRSGKPFSLINRIKKRCYIKSYDKPLNRNQRRIEFRKRRWASYRKTKRLRRVS